MALNGENAMLDVAARVIRAKVDQQTWFQANRNTVTATVGLVLTVATWGVSNFFPDAPWAGTAVLITGFIATVFGVKKTPNGWSASQVAWLETEHAREVDRLHNCDDTTCETPDTSGRYE